MIKSSKGFVHLILIIGVVLVGVVLFVYKYILGASIIPVPAHPPANDVANINYEPEQTTAKPQPLSDQETYTGDTSGSIFDYKKYTELEKETGVVIFSMEYPESWTRNYSVFTDIEGNKVAEFSAGSVDQAWCNREFDTSQGRVELISQNEVKVGDLVAVYRVTTIVPEGSKNPKRWYPNSYCLRGEKNYVGVTFYEYSAEPSNKKLHEKVLESIILY